MNGNMQKPNQRPDMFKTSVDQNNLPTNYIYGVDTNNRKAVEKAYKRLKRSHIIITFFSLILVAGLIFLTYDFMRVNMWDKKPILGTKKKIDGGYIYKGIGYNAMYCDNGNVYKTYLENKTCSDEPLDNSFKGIVTRELKKYLVNNKYLDESKLVSFTLETMEFDENNEFDGADYIVDINLVCKDESASCMKIFKEIENQNKPKLYISLDRGNKVVDVKSFKSSGKYYNSLKEDYTNKVKEYMISKGYIDEDNLRLIKVSLKSNHGRYRFEDVMYADTYVIEVEFFCQDDTNACINRFDNYIEYSNLNFLASMFLDENNDVVNLRSSQVLS